MKRREKKRRKVRNLIVFFGSLAAFLGVFGIILLWPRESLVASGTLSVSSDKSITNTFDYHGSSISQSMSQGCSVPATFKLNTLEITKAGKLSIYLNDLYVGYAEITKTGEVAIVSGCGCSTSCICEIRVGDNVIKFVSQGFSGQVKYEVYVKKS